MLPARSIPSTLLEKLDKAQLYSSAVTISMGINCPVENLALSDEMVFITRDDIDRTEHNSGDPHKCGLSVLAPSFRDPSLAPSGKGTVTIYAYATFDQDEFWHTEINENGQRVRGEAYNKFKNDFADVLIKRVSEKLGHDLKPLIEYLDIATPITHWRYTGNRNGSLMGARPGKANMQAGIAHIKTPIDNLWLGGHWAELGGGVPVAVKAGMNAAILILKQEKPEAFQLVADYIDHKAALSSVKNSNLIRPYSSGWTREPTPSEK
jgi:phytoene dehydrogenase-like protein